MTGAPTPEVSPRAGMPWPCPWPSTIKPDLPLPDLLVDHPARNVGPPRIEAAENREHHPAKQHVVEMRDHEVGVGLLEIDRHAGVHDTAQSAESKFEDCGDAKEKCGSHPQRTAPHGRNPTENF